jgi:hypothetical protein
MLRAKKALDLGAAFSLGASGVVVGVLVDLGPAVVELLLALAMLEETELNFDATEEIEDALEETAELMLLETSEETCDWAEETLDPTDEIAELTLSTGLAGVVAGGAGVGVPGTAGVVFAGGAGTFGEEFAGEVGNPGTFAVVVSHHGGMVVTVTVTVSAPKSMTLKHFGEVVFG